LSYGVFLFLLLMTGNSHVFDENKMEWVPAPPAKVDLTTENGRGKK
jgi:hypothetical protein